jgi:pimeloyl-[acyl-carrier protein] methyl ester esterase
MNLHVETTGDGPDVVLLHGWGMNSGVWREVRRRLAARFRVHALNLPGHGSSDAGTMDSIDALAHHVARALPERCAVCGWSLGGEVALAWAHQAPRQVTRLALIATSPCFTLRDDWPHALEPAAVREFSQALTRDCEATLRRFVSLQAQGDVHTARVMRLLRLAASEQRQPDALTLRQNLAILLSADLRPQLPAIQQPALVIHGDRDALVPLAAGKHLSQALPDARLAIIHGAAHAPFASNPEEVGALLLEFFDEG